MGRPARTDPESGGGPLKRVPLDPGLDPYALFAASRDEHPHAFLLESLTGPERLREHTFVGFDPERIVSYRGGVLRSNGDSWKTERPLDALRAILRELTRQRAFLLEPLLHGGGQLVVRQRAVPEDLEDCRLHRLVLRPADVHALLPLGMEREDLLLHGPVDRRRGI